jgi:hypothetical protein
MGRKVVYHHDVAALERRCQALLDVGHEGHANVAVRTGLISKRSAASRRDAPASTASITRPRRSPDNDFGIVVAPAGESMR